MERILATCRRYLPQARPYVPYAGILLVFALLGGLSGILQSTKAPADTNVRESWSMPEWSRYQAGNQRQTVAEMEIWDGKKVAQPKPEPQAQQAWQFIGTVRKGKSYAAVILLGDSGRIQRAVSGDVLPNGEKILVVENGMIQIDSNGAQREIKLFQQEKK
jgi:hypothetical protein